MAVEIRPIAPTELEQLHALRPESLRDSPAAFGSTYAVQAAHPPERRARWVADGVARAALDGSARLGLARGVAVDSVLEVDAMWVSPERRRSGIPRAPLRSVVEWGATRGATSARQAVVATT
jgi:GNAT superfamily N-acetyltransferase